MLKKESSIKNEKIISLVFVFTIVDKLLAGRKPPEDIRDMDKLNESKVLKSNNLSIKKIKTVKIKYKINILNDCLKVSDILNDKKLVNDFLIFSSKISINKIKENKKYSPPTHWDDDLHKIKLSSKCLMLLNIVNPVEVKPEIDSK